MSRKKRPHLIAYDIADRKRLQQVHRLVKEHAIPLQHSVYLAQMTPSQCKNLISKLQQLVHATADDIRIYTLPQKPDWASWGKPIMPEGLLLTDFALPSDKSSLE